MFTLRGLAPLIATLVLAACADRPAGPDAADPAPPLARATVAEAPSAVSTRASDALAIHRWDSRGPARAVILALHGFGDAGELTFERAADYWAGRGITVYAPDQRGFGANPDRKQWPGADALVSDAVALAASIRRDHPQLPLVVVGHSMGGGVALAAAAEGMEVDALVLAAPAIAGGTALNPFYRIIGGLMAVTTPERRWTGGNVVRITPSDNREALYRVSRDPRHFANPSSRELYGLIRVLDRAAAAAPGVAIPTLTLTGAKDEVLRSDQVGRIHARIPGAVGWLHYPDGWHWLFRDLQAPQVWRDVADFALSAGAAPEPLR